MADHNRGTMPSAAPFSTELLHIPVAADGAPLGAQQKKFNTLIERIAAQRELLAQWQQAEQDFRRRYAEELQPAVRDYQALLVQHLHWLDAAYARKGLSKADRATLADMIADMAADVAQATADEAVAQAMTALHDRYAATDYATQRTQMLEDVRAIAEAALGLDLQGVDMSDSEAVLRHAQQQWAQQAEQQEAQRQAQQAQAEAARAAHQQARKPKPSAKERKAQEEAQQASQSVREIYRKLASSLHPDREPDPAERARKTALMQRANQAYADNKLLDLLQLQLEAEHIDAAHLARVSEERLKHYNRVLTSQYQELQAETQALRMHLQAQLPQHVRLSSKPASLAKAITADLQNLRQHSLRLQRTMRALDEDPQQLKAWLKEQRRLIKEQDFYFF